MRAVGEDEACERRRGGAVTAGEPAERAPDPDDRAARDDEAQREPDDAEIGEKLERDAVGLCDRDGVRPMTASRECERARPRAPERPIRSDVERLSPPLEPIVGAELREPAGLVDAFAARELGARPRERVAGSGCETDPTRQEGEHAGADERRAHGAATLDGESAHRCAPRDEADDDRAAEREHRERPAVRHTFGAQDAVVHESGPRERPAGDDGRGDRGDGRRAPSSSLSSESASHRMMTAAAPTSPARDWVRSATRTAA